MAQETKLRRVILRRCDAYAPQTLEAIITEGVRELGLVPRGRVLIKPNVVTANKGYIHHSYTEPAIIKAMVESLRNGFGADQITIGESGGIGMPSRMFFAESGIGPLAKKLKVPMRDFNEEAVKTVPLEKGKYHKTMAVAKSLYQAEFKVWMPKLKFHIVTDLTHALKLNIGLLNHKERFLYHDDRLHDKIVDMLEIGWPDLVVSDAITIGRGFESSPYPVHLGAVILSNDPVACDVVAAKILGYDPENVRHLAEARDRGYGSLDIDQIRISGDITIEALRSRIKDVALPVSEPTGNWRPR